MHTQSTHAYAWHAVSHRCVNTSVCPHHTHTHTDRQTPPQDRQDTSITNAPEREPFLHSSSVCGVARPGQTKKCLSVSVRALRFKTRTRVEGRDEGTREREKGGAERGGGPSHR
uniref:Uncharacterized protein n=1 Tax=Vitrella brassicaformis TaxID=1169539 RepID=A0A7S1PAS4_9ALVE|mmetsp:Transcript_10836/g.31418  ORF Transcript_10836/g.31418 Transcript_10836/m.31418 type:complete len:114 (+) Transcript_10836:1353-1694(+)